MEEQLRHREQKLAELEAELAEVRRKGQREKEILKRATKQHRSQAAQSEHTVEALAAQIEDMVSDSSVWKFYTPSSLKLIKIYIALM
jgi:regulator of protease activity HflC (stomatin/prohibitin superfamily)